ncbi:hypothetical protein HZU77_014915 [Neisseriaceae bacterium TC5R-5]|nr:hypothetical protein [Neisseriaceae bacterium TC5R-5]
MSQSTAHLKAALALSALNSADRRWLQSRLETDEYQRLAAALDEMGGGSLAEQAQQLTAAGSPVLDQALLIVRYWSQLVYYIANAPAWQQANWAGLLGEGRYSQLCAEAARDYPALPKLSANRGRPLGEALRAALLQELSQQLPALTLPRRRAAAGWQFWRRA